MAECTEDIKLLRQLWQERSKEIFLDTKDWPNKPAIHSLTARSISKEFREVLKSSKSAYITFPGGTIRFCEGAHENENADRVVTSSEIVDSPDAQPGTVKKTLAFFESLSSKINKKKATA